MNKKIQSIAATVLSLAIATPFAIHADQGSAMPEFDTEAGNIAVTDSENYDYYNQATEFTALDEEGLMELSNMGIDNLSDDEFNDNATADEIIAYAKKYLGRPYRYGSKGPSSFDCSGFTSYVYRNFGYNLSSCSRSQATQGKSVKASEVKPGDLLFFGGRKGGSTVGHVAMAVDVADNGTITFIHASTKKGISFARYPDDAYYHKRFLCARRILED